MDTNMDSILAAIRRLGGADRHERARAREALERIGRPATWYLIQAVDPPGEEARHEALKVLVDLADPAALGLFVEHLEDEDANRRWLAAEGLAALREEGLRKALRLLIEFPKTEYTLSSLHHALGELRTAGFEQIVAPVLRAFESTVREAEIPKAAHEALRELLKHAPPRVENL